MSDVTNQFMKTGLKELIHFARGLQYIKPLIKMILGDESTTEMSRNHLSAFSTSVVFLRASVCKILILSFAHKMDFARNFSVDFF